MICHRCHADAVVGTVANMPLCWTCIRQVTAKIPPPSRVSGVFDDVPGPYSLGKEVGAAAPNPYAAGKEVGTEIKDSPSALDKGASAVKDITSTVKVLAVSGALLGGAFLIYTMWQAHRAQAKAVETVTAHPELFRAALIP